MSSIAGSEGTRWDLSRFTGRGYDKGRSVPWQVAWLVVDSLVFRRWWLPASARAQILRAFGATVGSRVLVRHDVRIHWPWKLTIGHDSWIGTGCWLLNLEPIAIGSNTCISQGAMICTGSHDQHSPTFEFDNAPVTVGDGVWVGARATLLRGVEIGDNATVGACALVVKSVSSGSFVLAPVAATQDSSR